MRHEALVQMQMVQMLQGIGDMLILWRQPVSGAGLQTSIRGAQLDVQTDVLGSGELSWPEVTIVPGLAQKTRGELRLGWVLHFPAVLVLDFGNFS